jgi:hypothetical protein
MFVPLRYETPDVTIARLIEKALVCDDLDYKRADAFRMIEYLINGADWLARKVMDEDEVNSFCPYLDGALSVLDDIDEERGAFAPMETNNERPQ